MFDKKCLRIGLVSMCSAMVASLLPGLFVYFRYGVIPSAGEIGSIFTMLCASFLVGWFVQPITFYPAIGVGASAISWTTGNVAGLRMPAISAGQKAAETEPGTPEADVISTMSVAVSSFVTVAILTIFTLMGSSIISALPKSVTSAFNYIAPAVFGAIIVDYAMKNWKNNIPIILVGVITFLIFSKIGLSSVWINLLVLIAGMFVSRALYVKNRNKAKKSENEAGN